MELISVPKALTRRHRDATTSWFSDDTDRQTHLRALARAFASAPWGASESAPEADNHPAPRVDPPGASGQL
ncbi:hypothetical protein [Natronosalvus halobius]|uniref:hypothetical protein n=1 Tax=Natronosalvus halobius TaxID=2953746 RepID=UPI00209E2CF5|nr:hypothetical protein [Natronosalvus halobius]USZ73512.1 hypothetical protein NGM15_17770 [Natronosalvus halobius]